MKIGQKQPSRHSCTELSKTVFPVSIVKTTLKDNEDVIIARSHDFGKIL